MGSLGKHPLSKRRARAGTASSRALVGLPRLVNHAQKLAVTIAAVRGVDLVLSTEDQLAEAIAERIRAALSHRLALPSPRPE